MDRSPTIGQMFAHMHHERMVSVLENAPEHAGQIPAHEWSAERDAHRIAQMPEESAKRVRDAVTDRVDSDRALDRSLAHPVQLLQFLIFHEGYHHGQIKLALKAAGCAIADADAGPHMGRLDGRVVPSLAATARTATCAPTEIPQASATTIGGTTRTTMACSTNRAPEAAAPFTRGRPSVTA
jgi:hypothetical protein